MAHFAEEDNPKTYECYFDSSMIDFITSHIRKCHPTFDRVQDELQIRPKQIQFYSGPISSLKFENYTFETLWKFELIDDGKKMDIKVRMCKIGLERHKGNLFIRYREMISNFVQTLNSHPSSVMRKLDYNKTNQSIEIVYFTISRENVFQFKRQCILNKIWRDIRQEITEVFFFNIIYQETVSEQNTLKFMTFRNVIEYERTSREKTCTKDKPNNTQDKNKVSSVLDLISPNNQKAQRRKQLEKNVSILFKSISDSVRQQLQRMSGPENEIVGQNLAFPSNPNIYEIASLEIEYQCRKFKQSRKQGVRKDHSGNICQGITVINETTSKQPIQETNFSRIQRMQVMFKYQLSVNKINDALNDQNQQTRQIQIQQQILINNNNGIQIMQNNDKNINVGRIQFQNRQLIVKRCLKDKQVIDKNEKNENVIRIKENLSGIWSFINQYVFIKFIRGEKFPFIARYYLKVDNQRQSQQRARTQEIIRNLKESFTKTMDGIMRTLQNQINKPIQTQTNDQSKKQPSKATQIRFWRQMRRMVYTINKHTQRGLTHDMQVNERMIQKLQELLEETMRKIQQVLEISSREVFSPIKEVTSSSQESNSESESGGLSTMERRSRDMQKNSTNVERKKCDLEGSSQDVQAKYEKRIQALIKDHSKKLRKIALLPVADKQIYGDIYPERLYDFLEEKVRDSQLAKVNTMLYQIALTLFYLNEQKGILHRDIKTANIMLDKMGSVKFIDWGSCCNIVDERKSKDLADKAFQEIDQSLKTSQAFTQSKRDVERQRPLLLQFLYQNDRSKFQNFNKSPYFDIYSYGSIVSRFIAKLEGQCQLRDHWYVDQLEYLKTICWERNPYDRPRPKMILVYLSELAKVIYEKSQIVFGDQFPGVKSSNVLQV